MNSNPSIYVVDDNVELCQSLRFLFESEQFPVKTYANAELFLQSQEYKKQGCLIMDVRMPGMSGLELLEHFKKWKIYLPVIMVTAFGDIPMVVRAMKAGAQDFILKPFNNHELLQSVVNCLKTAEQYKSFQLSQHQIQSLTDQEHQIIHLILDGNLNKQIADKLSMSISSVEMHRSNIMKKLNANTLSQLIKIYLMAQSYPTDS